MQLTFGHYGFDNQIQISDFVNKTLRKFQKCNVFSRYRKNIKILFFKSIVGQVPMIGFQKQKGTKNVENLQFFLASLFFVHEQLNEVVPTKNGL